MCNRSQNDVIWGFSAKATPQLSDVLFPLQNYISGLPLLNYPNVCTNCPQHGKAFCAEHLQYLNEKQPTVPTGIREFLSYCGVQRATGKAKRGVVGIVAIKRVNYGLFSLCLAHCAIL